MRRRIFVSKDVIFDETVPGLFHHSSPNYSTEEGPCTPEVSHHSHSDTVHRRRNNFYRMEIALIGVEAIEQATY